MRKSEIKKLIQIHNRRLQKLKEQQAILGISTTPEIIVEIEDIETVVEKLQTELKKLEDISEPVFLPKKTMISEPRKISSRPQVNPFIFGSPVPPPYFIGREEIINICYNRLAGLVRTSIALSGETGTGKTSFAHYLIHVARQEQWGQPVTHLLFVYMDCRVIDEITPTRFWQYVLELLKHTEDDPILGQGVDLLLEQSQVNARHIHGLLRWLERQQRSVILVLDEFEYIVESKSTNRQIIAEILSSFRALSNAPEFALTSLIITREPLDVISRDLTKDLPGSDFYNNFVFVSLLPFTFAESDTLLNNALSNVNFSFDKADFEFLHRVAGNHPALLQIYGHYLFEWHRRGAPTNSAYEETLKQAERSVHHYFSRFWYGSTPLTRALLVLIIVSSLLEKLDSNLYVNAQEETYRLLQRYKRDLIRLTDSGLVDNVGGSYIIFSTTFSWWIISEISKEKAENTQTPNQSPLSQTEHLLRKLIPYLTFNEFAEIVVIPPHTHSH